MRCSWSRCEPRAVCPTRCQQRTAVTAGQAVLVCGRPERGPGSFTSADRPCLTFPPYGAAGAACPDPSRSVKPIDQRRQWIIPVISIDVIDHGPSTPDGPRGVSAGAPLLHCTMPSGSGKVFGGFQTCPSGVAFPPTVPRRSFPGSQNVDSAVRASTHGTWRPILRRRAFGWRDAKDRFRRPPVSIGRSATIPDERGAAVVARNDRHPVRAVQPS